MPLIFPVPLSVALGGTGVTTSTGSGSNVLNTSPTLVTPILGVATATRLGIGIAADATYPLAVDKGSGSGVVQRWTNNNTANAYLVIGGTGVAYFASASDASYAYGVSTSGLIGFYNNTQTHAFTSGQASFGSTLGLGSLATNSDVFLVRIAAATLQHGQDVNGAAVSQILQAANGITGTDKTGGNFTIRPGAGTGAGAISSAIIQSPTLGTTGTTAQAQATRLTINQTGIICAAPLWVSNAAVTGLIAGALSALTTASIVIYDSTGTAYRVPCITP